MKIDKNYNTSLNLVKDNYQYNKFSNSLENKIRISNTNLINIMDNNVNKKKILLNNIQNKIENEQIINQNNPKTTKYKKGNCVFSVTNKNEGNMPFNLTYDNWSKKPFIQSSFSLNNKIINIKDQKVKRSILSTENITYRSNQNNFNKTSYPLSKNNNVFHYKDEEPHFLNDKFISNSFIINNEDKIKKYKNNGYNENPSKLLSKDVPSSLNNTERYMNSKLAKDENNNNIYSSHNDYTEEFITFRNKDFILYKENNKTIEYEKMNNPKKVLRPNITNKFKNKKIYNLTYSNFDNFDIDVDFNECKLKNNNFRNLVSLNTVNNSEKYKNVNLGESNELLLKEKEKNLLKLNIPKLKTKAYPKNKLFNNNQINEYKNKNNNYLVYNENKIYISTQKMENKDNKFLNSLMQPCEIESRIISFRNPKSNFKEEENDINNFPDNLYNKIKYKKKKIVKSKKCQLYLKRKLNINIDETENTNTNEYTFYTIYKKPNLSVSQNINTDYTQKINNNEANNLVYSHFNIYNNTENNNQEDMFYKRQYLGDVFMKYKNKKKINVSNKCNTVFRKKQITYLNYNDNNTYNISTLNTSPIYTKKNPSFLRKFNKKKLLENFFKDNILSNSQTFMNKNNKIYIKKSNDKINSTNKLFNSQIINIKNNIFYNNDNNNSNVNENINNTSFGEKAQIINKKNEKIKSKIINNYSFDVKLYNYYVNLQKKKSSEKTIKNNSIMKKNLLPFSYYSKSKVKIIQIPQLLNCNYTKIRVIKNKNEDNMINNKIKDNKKILTKNNKLMVNTNKNKGRNIIKRNNNEKLEYDSKTIKGENRNEKEINNGLIKIKVARKKLNQKNKVKNNNKDKNTNINNIQEVRLNETEINYKNNKNESESIINDNNSEIINYPQIPLSPRILKKLEEIYNTNINNNNNFIKKEEKKEIKKSSVKIKINSLLRKRSSSIKIRDKRSVENNEKNNILKIKMPNSEARKKKYKINIIKRLKVKCIKNLSNFSEEKILINNCNNDINQDQNIIKRNKNIQKSKKENEKNKKISLIIKEDLENYILFTMKSIDNKNILINNYNYSIIGQLLIKEKIDLSQLINFYLKICFELIDSKDKIYICNDYINNIIEKYKRTYLNKNNFIQIHDDILEILIDIIVNKNKKNQNKYKFDIVGALFYSLLVNELFFVSDLNMFIKCEEQIYINIAKILRYIIIYSNDDKFKNHYFEVFKNSKLFFNNPIYFKYVTKYLKLLNTNY